MAITRAKAAALIPGRGDLQETENMPDKIEITRNTVAGGEPVFVGQVFSVGSTITEQDAKTLLLMKKAKPVEVKAVKKPVIDEKTIVDPVEVENRDDEVAAKIVKRTKKSRKKSKK